MAVRKTTSALTVLLLVLSSMTMVASAAPMPPVGESGTPAGPAAPLDDVVPLADPSDVYSNPLDDGISLVGEQRPMSKLEGASDVTYDQRLLDRLPEGKGNNGVFVRGETDHRATNKVLLIDDDDSTNVGTTDTWNNSGVYDMDTGQIIDKALTDAGYTHDHYIVEAGNNGPDFQMMTNYSTLVWCFGYEWGYLPTLTRADYFRLMGFMEAGGSVWFIGNALISDMYGLTNYTTTGQNRFGADDFAKKYLGVEEYFPWSGLPGTVNTTASAIMAGTEQYATQHYFNQFDDPSALFSDVTRPVSGGIEVLIGDSTGQWGRTFDDEPVAIAYDSGTWRTSLFNLDLVCIASATDRAEIAGKVMDWLTYGKTLSIDFSTALEQHAIFNWYVEVEDQAPLWTADWDLGFWRQFYNPIVATVHTHEDFTAIAHFENHGRTNEQNFNVRFVVDDAAGRELANFTKQSSVSSRMTGEVSATFKPNRAGLYFVTTNITIAGDATTVDNAARSMLQAPWWVDDLENGNFTSDTKYWNKTGAWTLVNNAQDSNTPTHAWQLRRNNYQTNGDVLTGPTFDLRFYNTSFTYPGLEGVNMIFFNMFFSGRMFGTGGDSVDFQIKASNMTNWRSLFKVDGNTAVGTGIANGDFSAGWYRFNSGVYLGDYWGQTVETRWLFIKGNPISQSWWSVDDTRLWMHEEINVAPWFIDPTPGTTYSEMDVGDSLVLSANVEDPNLDEPITLGWLENYEVRPDWAGLDTVTLVVPQNAPVGDKYHRGNTVNIVFTASDGLDENATFWNIKLMDPKPRSTIDFTGMLSIDEDVPMDVDMSSWFRDIEDQAWTVTSTGSTNIKASTVTGSILNITNKLPNWNGEENITLRVTDSASSVANFTLRVVVRPVNDAPKIKVVQLPDALQDDSYSYNLTGTDIENDPLTWSDDTSLFDITDAGTIAFVPENADVGYHTFNITAEDPFGGTNTVEFTLFVANVNDPPTLRYIPPQTALEDEVWTLDVSDYVEDPDLLLDPEFRDRMNYRDDTPKLDTNLETGLITWDSPTNDDAAEEDFFFKITVQDSKGRYAEQEVKISVVNTNDPPKIGTIQKQTLHQDAPYVYTIPVTDEDLDVPSANEELTFTNDQTDLFTIDATTGRIQFTPVNNQVGTWEVNITVTDVEGDSATKKVIFEVVNKNDAPVLEFIKVQQLTEDVPYELRVEATDPDLEPRLVDGLPVDPSERLEFRTNSTKVPIDRDTGVINFTPTQTEVGEFMVKITVIDRSSDARTADVLFKVANVNDPPRNLAIVGIFANQTVTAGKSLQLIGSAQDDDNPTTDLTYMWYAGPKVIGQTSTIQWKPDGKGLTEVKLVVSDPDGGSAEYVIAVNIKKSDDGPGFTTILAFTAVLIVAAMVAVVRRRHEL